MDETYTQNSNYYVQRLNLARHALGYIIRTYNIKEMYVPYYTCPVIYSVLKKEKCKIKVYHIDEKFMPADEFEENDFVLYTNYFGVCARNVLELAKKYKNLVVDNAQAFYMNKCGIAGFNSARKFFGVPDGAYVYCKRFYEYNIESDNSTKRFSLMDKNKYGNFEFNYNNFCMNEKILDKEPLKKMSYETYSVLQNINYENVKKLRIENFNFLHNVLKSDNELDLNLTEYDVPMVYPYKVCDDKVGETLFKNNIPIMRYWRPLSEKFYESTLQKYLIPIPIESKYDIEYMQKILSIIKKVL